MANSKKIRRALDILIETPKNDKITSLEPFKERILKARALGWSYKVIAQTLSDSGLNVSSETVRRFERKIS